MTIERIRNWSYPERVEDITGIKEYLRSHYRDHIDESTQRIQDFGEHINAITTDDITEGATNLFFTDERCQDIAGGMFTGNTETFITATYQDGDGTVDLVVPVKDEDDMVSDSATFLATQQSIKKYVDDNVGVSDHGALTGLADDDHTQYIKHVLSTASNDFLVGSGSNAYIKKTLAETGAILETDINHDNLVGFVANEHIDHSGVTLTAGTGLTGGGDISANRTISLSHLGLESLADPDDDRLMGWDDVDGALKWFNLGAKLSYDHTSHTLSASSVTLQAYTNRAYACDSQSDAWQAASMFIAKINAGGTGGLTATNVPYDNDSNEGVIAPHSSYAFDGHLVLHNTTRSEERFIEDIDTTNNYITTISSSDSWADNDDITAESQVNTGGTPRFMDLDLSDMLGESTYGVIIEAGVFGSGVETLYLHPYEAFGAGKIQQIRSDGNGNGIYRTFIMNVNSQRICIAWNASGAGTLDINLRIIGWW